MFGNGDPVVGLGSDGQFYFDNFGLQIWYKKLGAWSDLGSLTSPPSAPPPPPPPAPPPPAGGDILSGGAVDPTLYLSMAYDLDAFITYKYGAAATASGVQTLNERADIGSIDHGGGVNTVPYQFGPEIPDGFNAYMTIDGAVIGKPLTGNSVDSAVAWIQNFALDRNTAQQRPYRLWQDNPLLPPPFRPGAEYVRSQGLNGFGPLALNNAAYLPVCEYRGENLPDSPSTRLSLICTQGSPTIPAKLMTVGTYTAKNPCLMDFPLGMRPTAIGVVAGGEIGVVSLWDTNTTTGKVAIIALGSAPQGVNYQATGPTARYDWWGGWRDTCKPGFVDQGNFVFAKIIQLVDLPSTMKAPTGIAVTSGINTYRTLIAYGPNGITNFMNLDSPMANFRSAMLPGGADYERYAKGAIAKVISQSEKSGCYIDLGPVYAYLNDMYLGSPAKNLETQTLGFGPTQWPYTLADKPAAQAVVVKSETYSDNPTAVDVTPSYGYWSKDDQTRAYEPDGPFQPTPHYPRARTLFRNGTLQVHSLGRYAAGIKPTTPSPTDIALVGTVTGLGNNCCSLAASKSPPNSADELDGSVVYVARADRKIGLIVFTTNSTGTTTTGVVSTLVLDSRMDPVDACVADPYDTISNVVSVADWTGACVRNYRYGPLISGDDRSLWSPGPLNTPSATPPGEYCGRIDLPFRPFSLHCSNTP